LHAATLAITLKLVCKSGMRNPSHPLRMRRTDDNRCG
jgi:hypothetical protein